MQELCFDFVPDCLLYRLLIFPGVQMSFAESAYPMVPHIQFIVKLAVEQTDIVAKKHTNKYLQKIINYHITTTAVRLMGRNTLKHIRPATKLVLKWSFIEKEKSKENEATEKLNNFCMNSILAEECVASKSIRRNNR